MLTDDLTQAMDSVEAPRPFELDVSDVFDRSRRLRTQRFFGAGTTLAVVTVVATLLAVSLVTSGSGPDGVAPGGQHVHIPGAVPEPAYRSSPALRGASPQALARQAVTAFSHWGPARGDLANDPTFLTTVRQEWRHPTGDDYVQGPSDFSGPIRVLFAGNTPGGPAAVVAQRSTNPETGIYVGVMLSESGHLDLWGPNSPAELALPAPVNVGRFDAQQVSFAVDAYHVVVLPTDPTAAVQISTGHTTNSHQVAIRNSWSTVPITNGVGVADMPFAVSSWDTLLRLDKNHHVVDEAPLWIASGPPPSPSNALGLWTRISSVLGDSGIGIPPAAYLPWVARYGATDEPFGISSWGIEGVAPNHTGLIARQIWLNGDPAHTVVIGIQGSNSSVLADQVTHPNSRPLLAVRLASVGGWLVVAGPQATVTGYRLPGQSTWTAPPRALVDEESGSNGTMHNVYSRAAAFIATTSHSIDLQLTINGGVTSVHESE